MNYFQNLPKDGPGPMVSQTIVDNVVEIDLNIQKLRMSVEVWNAIPDEDKSDYQYNHMTPYPESHVWRKCDVEEARKMLISTIEALGSRVFRFRKMECITIVHYFLRVNYTRPFDSLYPCDLWIKREKMNYFEALSKDGPTVSQTIVNDVVEIDFHIAEIRMPVEVWDAIPEEDKSDYHYNYIYNGPMPNLWRKSDVQSLQEMLISIIEALGTAEFRFCQSDYIFLSEFLRDNYTQQKSPDSSFPFDSWHKKGKFDLPTNDVPTVSQTIVNGVVEIDFHIVEIYMTIVDNVVEIDFQMEEIPMDVEEWNNIPENVKSDFVYINILNGPAAKMCRKSDIEAVRSLLISTIEALGAAEFRFRKVESYFILTDFLGTGKYTQKKPLDSPYPKDSWHKNEKRNCFQDFSMKAPIVSQTIVDNVVEIDFHLENVLSPVEVWGEIPEEDRKDFYYYYYNYMYHGPIPNLWRKSDFDVLQSMLNNRFGLSSGISLQPSTGLRK